MKLPRRFEILALMSTGPVGRGAVLSLTIRTGAIGLLFLQAVLIARLLGPAGYGVFSMTLSVASVLASISLLGLGGYAVREASRLRVRAEFGALRGFVRWAPAIVAANAVIVGAAMAGVTRLPNLEFPAEFAWGLAIVPLMALILLLSGVSQGFGRVFNAQAPTDLVRPATVVFAMGAAMVFAFPITVDGALKLVVVANVLALSLAVFAVLRTLHREVPDEPKVYRVPDWIRSAAPFFGMIVLATLQTEINTLMLGWLSGPRETGLFQPILRFAPVMVLAIHAVNVPLSPRISELWEMGATQRLESIVGLATIATTLAVCLTCGALLLLAPWILSAFGAGFTANVPALVWLAVAQIVTAACGPVRILLNMTGRQTQSAICMFVSVLVNFGLGVWLIPDHGAYGAAIAMSTSIVVWNFLMLKATIRGLGFDPSLVNAARNIKNP